MVGLMGHHSIIDNSFDSRTWLSAWGGIGRRPSDLWPAETSHGPMEGFSEACLVQQLHDAALELQGCSPAAEQDIA